MDPNSPHSYDPREREDSGPVITEGGAGSRLAAPSLPAIFVTTLTVSVESQRIQGQKTGASQFYDLDRKLGPHFSENETNPVQIVARYSGNHLPQGLLRGGISAEPALAPSLPPAPQSNIERPAGERVRGLFAEQCNVLPPLTNTLKENGLFLLPPKAKKETPEESLINLSQPLTILKMRDDRCHPESYQASGAWRRGQEGDGWCDRREGHEEVWKGVKA